MTYERLLSLAAVLTTAGFTTAQIPAPTIPWPRTLDLLVVDNTAENVYRLSDFNQDGDYYDAGEVLLYYDDNANGDLLSTTTAIACSPTGAAYIADSNTDIVLALRDLDYDGAALTPGEATVFFDSATNASGITMLSATGLVVDQIGRVYVLVANSGTTTINDGIIELVDLNGDGDANDLGEARFYFEVPNSSSPTNASVPSDFALGLDGAFYFGDGTGTGTKGIYRVFDADANGVIDPTEYGLWWTPPFTSTVPAWHGIAFDYVGFLCVSDHGGGSSVPKAIHRAFDLDGSGAVDPGQPEVQQVFSFTGGSAIYWDMLQRADGTMLLLDSTPDGIHGLRDLDGDFDFLDPGESMLVFDDTAVGLSLDLRAMAMMRAPTMEMSPNTVAIGGTTNFVVRTAKPFDLAVTGASLALITPVAVPPYGWLEIDPSTLILFGAGLADAQGAFTSPLTLVNDPALIGAYGCTSMSGDFYRLFLANGAPLTVTP